MERWQIFRFTIRLCQQKRRQNTIQMTGVKLQLSTNVAQNKAQQAVLLQNQEMQLTMQNEESTSLFKAFDGVHLLKKKIQQRSRDTSTSEMNLITEGYHADSSLCVDLGETRNSQRS